MNSVRRSRDKVEDAAYEILNNCNVILEKSPEAQHYLRKGEGKTVSGAGVTNYMIYEQIAKTL